MKKDIHPKYKSARITCACGNVIETRSTAGDMSVEICSNCHPFFTGKQKLIDTAGRVEKFRRKYGIKEEETEEAPEEAPEEAKEGAEEASEEETEEGAEEEREELE
ncbi:hypothetical protein AMJ39_03595 [candidate division TA06 bacterium DG_24]|jgi:large subunit ribosomal protein L31|uniref:Large ribosomal subunit protein bL31 n=3 Tax=Bacteria division TA06 TaxID=1156500 RepID=A0A0S8JKN2_UNCT6|nr:MAG: hypothetical protein AMJ39_03595 [candidate division TA06 bacterium DG_24]KPK67951.1 MAG: hypothetical protein AMJ82_09505 [candidate division TA06 bacterium SM23_40]KPL10324.1 MAG: hypothetical protein AMJ71_03505 [candidate division TA06 bacterium SM1_40]